MTGKHLDALTSDTPTFPYPAEQSQEFIDLLQRGKGVFRTHCDLFSNCTLVLGRQCFEPLRHHLRR